MPVHDAMSNLQLENQIPSTSGGVVDSPSSGRITRARTRGKIINILVILIIHVILFNTLGAQYPPQRSTMSPSPPPEKKPEKRKPGRPPGRPAGSKKQPVQIQPVDVLIENDGTLYGAIRNGRVSLQVKYFTMCNFKNISKIVVDFFFYYPTDCYNFELKYFPKEINQNSP